MLIIIFICVMFIILSSLFNFAVWFSLPIYVSSVTCKIKSSTLMYILNSQSFIHLQYHLSSLGLWGSWSMSQQTYSERQGTPRASHHSTTEQRIYKQRNIDTPFHTYRPFSNYSNLYVCLNILIIHTAIQCHEIQDYKITCHFSFTK